MRPPTYPRLVIFSLELEQLLQLARRGHHIQLDVAKETELEASALGLSLLPGLENGLLRGVRRLESLSEALRSFCQFCLPGFVFAVPRHSL